MGKFNSIQLMKMPWLKLFSLALVSVFTVSCLEKDIYQGPEDNGGGTDGTANLFDYSTKKSLTINIDYQKNYEVPFKVFYSNPLKADGTLDDSKVPFIDGKTPSNGKISIKYNDLPAGTSELFVYSPTLTVKTLLSAKVTGDVINLVSDKNDEECNDESPETRASGNGSYYTGWKPRDCNYEATLGNWDNEGYPDYLMELDEKEREEIEHPKFMRTITGTLNGGNVSYGLFLTHEYITLSEKANVFINFVEHRADNEHNNTLAYYVLAPGEEEPANVPVNLSIAFPNMRAKGLKLGDKIQLKYKDGSENFPKGSRIAFVLLKDAFKNGEITKNVNLVYSRKRYNAYTIKKDPVAGAGSIAADRPHMFAFMANDKLVLSFEDMPWHERRTSGQVAHADFSDDIFTITANPVTALPDDVEPGIDPEEEVKPDMTISAAGVLAFEDNWPKAGDYDLNDVMFGYVRNLNIKFANGDLTLLSIDEKYTFLNDGAKYRNGFGYEIGGEVKRKDVTVIVNSNKLCEGQGLDLDLTYATVMLIDDTRNLEKGTTFEVKTKFKNMAYAYTDFVTKPYNPFIVSMGYDNNGDYLAENRVEVHLPKTYEPTPKANRSLFGTENDMSLVNGSNFYYIRSGNYPFALEIVAPYNSTEVPNFRVPVEEKPIDFTYPKFNDWVKDPSANADWWK